MSTMYAIPDAAYTYASKPTYYTFDLDSDSEEEDEEFVAFAKDTADDQLLKLDSISTCASSDFESGETDYAMLRPCESCESESAFSIASCESDTTSLANNFLELEQEFNTSPTLISTLSGRVQLIKPPPGLELPVLHTPPMVSEEVDDMTCGLCNESSDTYDVKELRSDDLPSLGSCAHATGNCKPCNWFHKAKGCSNGFNCRHCHLCPPGEVRSRQKERFSNTELPPSDSTCANGAVVRQEPPTSVETVATTSVPRGEGNRRKVQRGNPKLVNKCDPWRDKSSPFEVFTFSHS